MAPSPTPSTPCSHRPRIGSSTVVLLALAVLLAGCARSDDTAAPAAERGAGSEPAREAEVDDEDMAITPTREARALDRDLQRLLDGYAPVSARVNFVVAAETLRIDAVSSRAPDAVIAERAGAVRLELQRTQRILEAARDRLTAASPTRAAERVRGSMLDAIDARAAALTALEQSLDAAAAGDDVRTTAHLEAWDAQWNRSLRSARAATTTLQDARERVGLEPAPEDSIR